ncbi:hypothetical protein [Natronobacterium texcoconense]|uniref:Uncharacterized protein n=1 Tax=Natronobacterium texcoconense TaxID=1095778 RepID=A0A1H1IXZ4_NATTX|nr:hypothetical protein [Natronobacterium texcoconense]SDR42529.1 hypothetical protein SAMN04489842_3903 [Natronobacterium texcoconense]
MTERPPSPPTAGTGPALSGTGGGSEDRVVVTTAQLATQLEEWTDYRPDEQLLENVLLELDRRDYLEWETITRNGDYCWDLTDTPERLGKAIAAVVTALLQADP